LKRRRKDICFLEDEEIATVIVSALIIVSGMTRADVDSWVTI
jgi:hypothetical protein